MTTQDEYLVEPIAVIGLACRLPGAPDVPTFWQHLVDGVESVRSYTHEEQERLGVPAWMLQDPHFVRSAAVAEGYADFDAPFFAMSPREAEVRDPQQRMFLELAHTALEDAGYDSSRYEGEVAVYGATGPDEYQWLYIRPNREFYSSIGTLATSTGNNPDYLATLTSYKLDLRGPSLTLHTACSSSLVSVHLACESLRNGECDMALTGGVSIDLPPEWGYLYHQDGIVARDGHCKAFDASASGTIWGSGGAMVLLKRLSDAIADGDHIRAVVLGNAINNDGAAKAGFSAPSAEAQAAAISQALGVAGVDPRTITYVEAHGTGTALGDPIEISGLSTAFATGTTDTGWCAIGSVKTNIGHLGRAAGIAGFAKAVLAIEHGVIPPSLHFEEPNPKIDFGANPFYVNAALADWKTGDLPRRAGVSSFGIGGTNAHVVLQEPPVAAPREREPEGRQLLQLSARTPAALQLVIARLADRLRGPDAPALADVAFTLREGRKPLQHRAAVVVDGSTGAVETLDSGKRLVKGVAGRRVPQVAWLFPGQGAQFAGMGALLYRTEEVFRATVDECAELLREDLGLDLRELLFNQDTDEQLRRTELTQPALFAVEYALARLWSSWGVEPAGMIGHSIGEYVAATVAGVFDLPGALRLVAARGRLMGGVPSGSMLAVRLDESEVRAILPQELSVATVNGPGTCVVAGPAEQVAEFAETLAERGVGRTALRTSHAFHSAMMDPILGEFRELVAGVERSAPRLPFLSNVTGQWITAEQAVDPTYWARHLREPVQFGACVTTLLAEGDWRLLECGPGRQLAGLVQAQLPAGAPRPLQSLPGWEESLDDLDVIYAAAGGLWTVGVPLKDFGRRARRVPLPTYPFERTRHWVNTELDAELLAPAPARTGPLPVAEWFSVPVWKQLPPLLPAALPGGGAAGSRWLVFGGQASAGLISGLRTAGADVVEVIPGDPARNTGDGVFRLRPGSRDDYDALLAEIGIPGRIVHAWALEGRPAKDGYAVRQVQSRGFHSLLLLHQALAAAVAGSESDGQPDEQPGQEPQVRLDVLTTGTQCVTGGDLTRPEHATVEGVVKVAPLEAPWLSARHVDVGDAPPQDILAELGHPPAPPVPGTPPSPVALRAGRRWTREYQAVQVPQSEATGLREEGVYLITGGLGGIGITLAEDLARRVRARLVLLSRSGLSGERADRAKAAIERIEAAGGQVLVAAADVTDPAALRAVREQALGRFGRLDGIVHAAGLPGGGMAEIKEPADAERVLAPKVAGTLALREAFGDLELDFVMLCSSVTAVAGGFGQVDYCAANTFMDAYAQSPHGWQARVLSLNWGAWLEVGMAAEVAAPAAFRALQRGDQVIAVDHPMLTWRHGDALVCSGLISAQTHWVLDEHRIAGVPVLPGTGGLEAVRRAFEEVVPSPGPGYVPELSDVSFLAPLSVADGASVEMRVLFTPDHDFELVSIAGGESRPHTRGSAAWVAAEDVRADLGELRGRCPDPWPGEVAGLFPETGPFLSFGPRWRSLREVRTGQAEYLARLEAPPSPDLDAYGLHPALLDEATAFVCATAEESYLPLGYGRVTVRGPLPARCWSHARLRDTAGAQILSCDISIYDDDGREVVAITDFVARRIDQAAVGGAVGEGARMTAEQPGIAEDSAAAGMALDVAGAARGIGPADGADAFLRLLAVDLGPQTVVNATPLEELVVRAREVTAEAVEERAGAATGAADPAEEGDYLAPRTEQEAAVAGLWREVLGLTRIGVDDDFFDVGGNSLVAVQLISLIRKRVGVRLPMRSLFQTSTVAGMAELIEELRGTPQSASPSRLSRIERA